MTRKKRLPRLRANHSVAEKVGQNWDQVKWCSDPAEEESTPLTSNLKRPSSNFWGAGNLKAFAQRSGKSVDPLSGENCSSPHVQPHETGQRERTRLRKRAKIVDPSRACFGSARTSLAITFCEVRPTHGFGDWEAELLEIEEPIFCRAVQSVDQTPLKSRG